LILALIIKVGGILGTKEKLPIFIINLKASVERREAMAELCAKYNLSVTFLEATDGRLLSQEGLDRLLGKGSMQSTLGRDLSPSEVGCLLSHKAIYQMIVDEELGVCLILEDDIEFSEDLLQVLDDINMLPSDWEVVLLGHHGRKSRLSKIKGSLWGRRIISNNYKLVRPSEVAYGAYGYLINKRGASKLLAELECIALPLDHYTGDSSYINLYVVTPPVIGIHEDLSDNFHSMEGRKELQEEQASLGNSASFSWYKRMAIYLGLYDFLNSSFIIVSGILNQMKPLIKYK